MPFELLDSLSLPGDSERPNDDSFGFSEKAALVMDGATSLAEPLMPGKSDAAWLAAFGTRRILAHLQEGMSARESLRAAMEDADRSFCALRRRAPAETYEMPFASMMLVAEQDHAIAALWFGDCTAVFQSRDGEVEIVGHAFASRAAEARGVAQLAKAKGLAPAAGFNRDEYLPSLRKARNRINRDGGAWLFGPDACAAGHVASRQLAAVSGTTILLATDGFLALASDYGRYNAAELMSAARGKGLEALGAELRAVEEEDPRGVRYPRFKTSDDATAVLLRYS